MESPFYPGAGEPRFFGVALFRVVLKGPFWQGSADIYNAIFLPDKKSAISTYYRINLQGIRHK
jgi:hypothetical protein